MGDGVRTGLGLLAVALTLVSYVPYVRDMAGGRTVPHAFSWLIWSLLIGLGTAVQLEAGAGPGAWSTAVTAAACVAICAWAFRHGDRHYTTVDWLCLAGAAVAGGVWADAGDPTVALLLLVGIDLLGYVPTIAKCWRDPWSETVSQWWLASAKHVAALGALSTVSFLTAFYPAVLVVANGLLAGLITRRRSQASAAAPAH